MSQQLQVVGARGSGPGHNKAGFGVFYGDGDNRNRSETVHSRNSKSNAELLASIYAMKQAIGKHGLQTLIVATSNRSVVNYIASNDPRHLNNDYTSQELQNFWNTRHTFVNSGREVYWVCPDDAHLADNECFQDLCLWGYPKFTDYDQMTSIAKKIKNALRHFDVNALELAIKAMC